MKKKTKPDFSGLSGLIKEGKPFPEMRRKLAKDIEEGKIDWLWEKTKKQSAGSMQTVKLRREGDAKLPAYQTEHASGADVCANEEAEIEPGEVKLVGTGLFLEIPEGYEIQVRPRSGLALKHGVTLLNTPGTIDADYRGEVKVIMVNHGKQEFKIKKGDRIAQLVMHKVERADFQETEELKGTERGEGGFGSTGV